ncbi:unnamed protein product [Echinostoma caproni]|uniref:AA_permease domain-containing protein n=1 Tax=Echinostoma caproni TaxID=27848 RepID=A0A183AQJ1_9TREM|nr:unnamed protein product [Echinostoma caproni]
MHCCLHSNITGTHKAILFTSSSASSRERFVGCKISERTDEQATEAAVPVLGAPRLLQAIAQDNVVPFLHPFKVTTKRGEPFRAQILSYSISQVGILIASIDSLTPLVTMFFLMCYGFVNLATMLNGFLREPSWRPRFRFTHW